MPPAPGGLYPSAPRFLVARAPIFLPRPSLTALAAMYTSCSMPLSGFTTLCSVCGGQIENVVPFYVEPPIRR
jgi:hypothetical protein